MQAATIRQGTLQKRSASERFFRRLKNFGRLFSRSEKLDVMFRYMILSRNAQ
jgi:transposase